MVQQKRLSDISQPQAATQRETTQKQFMIGLHPGPPPDHLWQEYENYSIYTAEQHRSVWERHAHDCTQITVAVGPAQVRGEWLGASGRFERRELSGDMVWIVPPGLEHVIHFDHRAPLLHLYLTRDFFRSMVEGAPDDTEAALIPSVLVRDPFLVELARSLLREYNGNGATRLYTQSIATVTATHLVRTYCRGHQMRPVYRGGLGPSREKRIRGFIDAHLCENLSLEDLARVAEVSPNYLITLFRQSMGMTPHKYVIQQRLERARHLLMHGNLTLLEIACQCGFHDQSQFTTIFRRSYGTTPGSYRRQV